MYPASAVSQETPYDYQIYTRRLPGLSGRRRAWLSQELGDDHSDGGLRTFLRRSVTGLDQALDRRARGSAPGADHLRHHRLLLRAVARAAERADSQRRAEPAEAKGRRRAACQRTGAAIPRSARGEAEECPNRFGRLTRLGRRRRREVGFARRDRKSVV